MQVKAARGLFRNLGGITHEVLDGTVSRLAFSRSKVPAFTANLPSATPRAP
jgi:hypothetical protein